MKRLSRLFDAFLESMGALAAFLLALITVGITAEIFIRGFNLGSLPWIIEAVEYSLLGVTFLSAPWVLKRSAHVRVDIVVENLRPGARTLAQIAADIVGTAVCAVIFYYGLKSAIRLYELDTRIFKVMTIKEWWLFALIPFSCALMIVEFLRRIVRTIRDDESGERPLRNPVDEANF